VSNLPGYAIPRIRHRTKRVWQRCYGEKDVMSNTSKALYLPLSAATSVAGGLLASALFGLIWKRLSDEESAPPNPKRPQPFEWRCSAGRRITRACVRCGQGGR
jgi:hypothetical protein